MNYEQEFKAYGSFIKFDEILDSSKTSVETQLVSLTGKLSENYTIVSNVLTNTIGTGRTQSQSVVSGRTANKNNLQSFILNSTKTKLGSVNTTIGLVIDDLVADMVAESETVLLSGKFYNYFNSNFNKALNSTAGVPTIDEAWVV